MRQAFVFTTATSGASSVAGIAAIPVVSVVGKSDSGKTTLMERLIRLLTERGYRVGSVKHHVHDFDIDIPGKDSWRHAKAGAAVTLVSSPSKLGMVRQMDHEASLDELLALAHDVDILLTEGYRRAGDVRIEVSRRARSTELVCEATELFALVTDTGSPGRSRARVQPGRRGRPCGPC